MGRGRQCGFISAVEGSAVEVVDTRYGDTGKEAQSALVEDALETHPDLDYIAGTAVTAEAAIPILRSRGLTDQISVLSYYFTPGVDQGISRGRILAAPTDSPVIQGRIAIDQAVRILEGAGYEKHVGPALYVVTADNHADFDSSSTLAPAGFNRSSASNKGSRCPASPHRFSPPVASPGISRGSALLMA